MRLFYRNAVALIAGTLRVEKSLKLHKVKQVFRLFV